MTLNPITHARRLAAYVAEDPNGSDPPERWDSPSKTRSVLGFAKHHPWLLLAGVFFALATVMFFVPILPTAHYNGWTLGVGVLVASNAYTAYSFRKKGLRTLQDYHLNIKFTGKSIEARLGRWTGDIDDRLRGFKVLKRLGPAGFRTAFEQFRDLYSRKDIERHKDKYHRVNSDGTGDVVRGTLKSTTFETEACAYDIDLFDGVSVSHIGEEQDRFDAKDFEKAATIAPVLDVRTTDKVEMAFRAESTSRRHADQELDVVRQQLDKLEEYVDPAGQPLFERTQQLLDEERQRREADTRNQRQTNGTGGEQ